MACMKETYRRYPPSAAVLAVVLVSGCNAGASSEPNDVGAGRGGPSSPASGGTEVAPVGSGEIVRLGLAAEPASLDFTTTGGAAIPQLMMDNVYETLVAVDQDGDIVPSLAESWQVSEDRLTYTFDLKQGVRFSNGADFTAKDAQFSLERVGTQAWTNGLASRLAAIDTVEAPDETTLVVTLSQPSNQFLFNLTTLTGAMFDSEGVANLAEEPLGTGPYTFAGWDRGSQITLQRNPDYHGQAPHFETVEMLYFRDGSALNNAMLTGAIDVLTTVQAPESLAEFKGGDYQIIEGTTNGEVVLSMNQAEGKPLADQRLREAIRHAIDHQALLDTCWAGKGQLIGSFVPPTDPWYEDRTGDFPFDLERARSLVTAAGVDGMNLRLRIPTLPYAVACGTVVESMLEEAGLQVIIDELEFPAAWLETVYTNKDYDLSIVSHVEGRDMASVFGNPDYYTTYTSQEVIDLIARADAGTEPEQIDRMKEAATTISTDAAADFLFLLPNLMVADPDITGLTVNQLRESLAVAQLARD